MSIRSLVLAAVASMLAVPVAALAVSDEPTSPRARTTEAAAAADPAVATVTPAATRYPAVTVTRAAIRIDEVQDPGAGAVVADTAGVHDVTSVRIGRVAVGAGPRPQRLVVAAVDPVDYRPFAPQVTADAVDVWHRLDEGAIAVTHEHAQRLGLALGRSVHLGGEHGLPVRVGAFATNGLPPIADAVVGPATAARLGLDAVAPTLLVAVDDDASVDTVARALGAALQRDVTVVPDPRAPAPQPVAPTAPRGATVWDLLAACESSGDWSANTGNGYYGGLQFLPESWWLVGGTGMPHQASREEQIGRAERLLAIQGWRAWPVCSVRLGLRHAGDA